MNETPFYKTRMGQRFFESTMPELVKQLERLADTVERLVEQRETDNNTSSGANHGG